MTETPMVGSRRVIAGLRAAADLLFLAEDHDLPLPVNVSVGEYSDHGPVMLVWTAEQWDAWRGFLDQGAETLHADNQLVLRGTAYECPVEVRAVLDTVAEAEAHMAGLEAATDA